MSGTYANSTLWIEVLKTSKPARSFCQSMDFMMVTPTSFLTYRFLDGSSKQAVTSITTATFDDPCGYKNPTFLQPRTSASLSYDYFMVKGRCSNFSPAIIDTDGALRWVGTAGNSSIETTFFDNAVYLAVRPNCIESISMALSPSLAITADLGIVNFHHNIDRGKVGIILDADTTGPSIR